MATQNLDAYMLEIDKKVKNIYIFSHESIHEPWEERKYKPKMEPKFCRDSDDSDVEEVHAPPARPSSHPTLMPASMETDGGQDEERKLPCLYDQ